MTSLPIPSAGMRPMVSEFLALVAIERMPVRNMVDVGEQK